MSASVDCYLPPSPLMHHQPVAMAEDDDFDDNSMSESRLTENGDEEAKMRYQEASQGRKTAATAASSTTTAAADQEDDDVMSKSSSKSSMSAFMSSLVGIQSEDWSFCFVQDNAKPRDLPPPVNTQHSANSNGSSSDSPAVHRPKNGISRWESAPSAPKEVGVGSSGTVGGGAGGFASKRPRAMRPWRPPSISNITTSSVGSGSTGSGGTKKADAPMNRPQRHDSNRSLNINAKRPQRYDSNRSLIRENSMGDFGLSNHNHHHHHHGGATAGGNRHHESTVMANSSMAQSMDLRVLLEECGEEDDLSVVGEGEETAVYLKFPAMSASGHSLWSSASTMTASFRTMSSHRSLMSHYSKEWNNSMQQSISVNAACLEDPETSHRSLFQKSEVEFPIRPPQRTNSSEREMHFSTNACNLPVRRPVRSPSDRSMLSGCHLPARAPVRKSSDRSMLSSAASSVAAGSASDAVTTAAEDESLLPPLKWGQESSANFSFKLIRSLSEQTMETTWRESSNQLREAKINQTTTTTTPATATTTSTTVAPAPIVRPVIKRTLSDSLLLFSDSFALTVVTDYGED